MKSMTGYGKGITQDNNLQVVVELKSLNNRFLEINTKLPKSLFAVDEVLREEINSQLLRGSVDVFFNYTVTNYSKELCADTVSINQYLDIAKSLQNDYGIANDLTFKVLLDKGLITNQLNEEEISKITLFTKSAVNAALQNLNQMRKTEGNAIKSNLIHLINQLKDYLVLATSLAGNVVQSFKQKIYQRIKEHLGGVEIDESKLLNEVAFFADKSDVNEELDRLNAHINQFLSTVNSDGEMGKKLDFICQELGREINTLGSKSNDLALTNTVIDMKNTLEKIKEQIRNVE